MNFVGIDLHKKTITVCVVDQERKVQKRATLYCVEAQRIADFFRGLGAFAAVVEATASYEWLWQLLEPLAQRLVLAHPKKLRVIAESKNKSDRLDAFVLAEFLALDMIPPAYRPTPRQRQHRALVRQRQQIRRALVRARNRLRHLLANYNADRRDLFTAAGLAYLAGVPVSAADRFVRDQLVATWEHHREQLAAITKELAALAKKAPKAERAARECLASAPGVGPVTLDVLLSEIGDIGRFRSNPKVVAYAGLAPGQRESAGRKKELGITKEGSRLLRWAMVQMAWRVVRPAGRWRAVFERLRQRRGAKKAIVAVARRLLGVLATLWRTGQRYRPAL
jgi:transposase